MRNKILLIILCLGLFVTVGCFSYRQAKIGDILKPREFTPLDNNRAFVPPPPPSTAISLTFFGDMMLDRNVKKQIDKNNADYIFEKLWDETSTTLFASDIVHANLEGPFADSRRPTSKSIAFRFDPALLPTLKKYQFNLFSLANNHSYDMGSAGFAESKENLEAAGFDFYGQQYGFNSTTIFSKIINNQTIFFVGLNDTNSAISTKELEKIFKIFSPANTVIINIHWGEEYKTISNSRQRTLAHWLIDNGADIIIGHHPHVVEEMEIYKNRPVFYSLGNFVFDQYFSTETQQGLAIKINFDNKKLLIGIFPLQGNLSQVSLNNDEKYFAEWAETCRLENNNFINKTLSLDYD